MNQLMLTMVADLFQSFRDARDVLKAITTPPPSGSEAEDTDQQDDEDFSETVFRDCNRFLSTKGYF